jgi:hypothetical protein
MAMRPTLTTIKARVTKLLLCVHLILCHPMCWWVVGDMHRRKVEKSLPLDHVLHSLRCNMTNMSNAHVICS